MSVSEDFEFIETKFGFKWGPLTVERDLSDPKGGVLLTIRTAHHAIEIRSSPKGMKLESRTRPLYDWEGPAS